MNGLLEKAKIKAYNLKKNVRFIKRQKRKHDNLFLVLKIVLVNLLIGLIIHGELGALYYLVSMLVAYGFYMHKERINPFLTSFIATLVIAYVWIYGMILTKFHTPKILMNVFMVMGPTIYVLNYANGKMTGVKYMLIWFFVAMINMLTMFYTCGAEIICLEKNKELLKIVENVMNDDVWKGAGLIIYTSIHHIIYPKLLLPAEDGLKEVLMHFSYDTICPLIIWGIYLMEVMIFTFFRPTVSK